MHGKPDVVAKIHFYRAEDGGVNNPLRSKIRCPAYINNEYFDCGFDLEKDKSIAPGDVIIIPVTFLSPKIVRPMLRVGSKFTLWAGRTIADCVVEEIIPE